MTGTLSIPFDKREMSLIFRDIAGHTQRGADRITIPDAGLHTFSIGITADGH
jgi:hypothetical protein